MTKPCKTTSTASKFHSASPKVAVDETGFGEEIEKKIAGKDKTAPKTATAMMVIGLVFVRGFSLSISPDRNRIDRVPMPTANWKIAT